MATTASGGFVARAERQTLEAKSTSGHVRANQRAAGAELAAARRTCPGLLPQELRVLPACWHGLEFTETLGTEPAVLGHSMCLLLGGALQNVGPGTYDYATPGSAAAGVCSMMIITCCPQRHQSCRCRCRPHTCPLHVHAGACAHGEHRWVTGAAAMHRWLACMRAAQAQAGG